MIYTLMQKDEPVMKLDINEKYGRVKEVIQIETPERLPLSVIYKDENRKFCGKFLYFVKILKKNFIISNPKEIMSLTYKEMSSN